jgi:RNA-binding protein Musashi
VGGLTWNTTKEMLYEEFSKYGEIVDWVVMKNPETGASRGFGFITYKDPMGAENALRAGPFKMDGKNVSFIQAIASFYDSVHVRNVFDVRIQSLVRNIFSYLLIL